MSLLNDLVVQGADVSMVCRFNVNLLRYVRWFVLRGGFRKHVFTHDAFSGDVQTKQLQYQRLHSFLSGANKINQFLIMNITLADEGRYYCEVECDHYVTNKSAPQYQHVIGIKT